MALCCVRTWSRRWSAKLRHGPRSRRAEPGVRHSTDFIILESLISARDFRETELTRKDKQRLRSMLDRCRSEPAAMSVERAAEPLDRLARAAGLD